MPSLPKPKVPGLLTGMKLTFVVDEGRRLAVSGIRIQGNELLSDRAIVTDMQTRPEGFFWWKKGEFDDDKYASDLTEKIPQAYGKHGFIEAQVLRDTLVVDRADIAVKYLFKICHRFAVAAMN